MVICMNPLGQLIYGNVFENIGNNVYLPFYIAAVTVIGVSIVTRHIFNGIDPLPENKATTKGSYSPPFGLFPLL